MAKKLENKIKKTLSEDIKDALVAVTICSILFSPLMTNLASYEIKKMMANELSSIKDKEEYARFVKEDYQNANVFKKAFTYGGILAVKKYLKNSQ